MNQKNKFDARVLGSYVKKTDWCSVCGFRHNPRCETTYICYLCKVTMRGKYASSHIVSHGGR